MNRRSARLSRQDSSSAPEGTLLRRLYFMDGVGEFKYNYPRLCAEDNRSERNL